MRMTFDRNVPIAEQISRRPKTQTGRKHQHRKGPGRAAAEIQAKRLQLAKVNLAKFRKYKQRVATYWRGETDEHP